MPRIAVLAALVVTGLLECLAPLAPSNWWWGLDTFRHWPRALGIALAALGWLGFVPPVARALERTLEGLGRRWERAGWLGDLTAAALLGLLLFALRDPVRFAGDSAMRLGLLNVSWDPRALIERLFPADMLVNYVLPRALSERGMGAANALQLVGAMVGALFVLAGCRLVRAAGARGASLPAGVIVLVGGALFTHFAGYDKFGPVLVGTVLAATGMIQLQTAQRGAGTLAAGVILALLSHRSGFLLLPGAAWSCWAAFRRADTRSRVPIVAAFASLVVVAAAVAPQAASMISVDLSAHLPGGRVAAARGAAQAPALWFKLANLANVLFFVFPLWLADVAALGALRAEPPSKPPRPWLRDLGIAAALGSAGLLALLVVVEPGAAWGRDWDVATPSVVVVALAGAFALVRGWRSGTLAGTLAPCVTLTLATSIALWGLHANESISLSRVTTLLASRPAWSAAVQAGYHDFWGFHFYNQGRYAPALEQFEQAIAAGGPNPRLVYQTGLARLELGDLHRAEQAFERSIVLKPTISDPWVGLARIAVARSDTARAIALYDSALRRAPDRTDFRAQLGALRRGMTRPVVGPP